MRSRARPRMSEQQQRDLMTTQASLTALTKHPSWPTLAAEIAKKEERLKQRVLALTLGSGNYTVEDIAFIRGFVAGMNYLVTVPENAEARLEDLLRKQGIEQEVESGRG